MTKHKNTLITVLISNKGVFHFDIVFIGKSRLLLNPEQYDTCQVLEFLSSSKERHEYDVINYCDHNACQDEIYPINAWQRKLCYPYAKEGCSEHYGMILKGINVVLPYFLVKAVVVYDVWSYKVSYYA